MFLRDLRSASECVMCAHVTPVLSLSVESKTGDAFCVGLVPLDFSSTNSSPLYAPPHNLPLRLSIPTPLADSICARLQSGGSS